jgi:hypothetical protein
VTGELKTPFYPRAITQQTRATSRQRQRLTFLLFLKRQTNKRFKQIFKKNIKEKSFPSGVVRTNF